MIDQILKNLDLSKSIEFIKNLESKLDDLNRFMLDILERLDKIEERLLKL